MASFMDRFRAKMVQATRPGTIVTDLKNRLRFPKTVNLKVFGLILPGIKPE